RVKPWRHLSNGARECPDERSARCRGLLRRGTGSERRCSAKVRLEAWRHQGEAGGDLGVQVPALRLQVQRRGRRLVVGGTGEAPRDAGDGLRERVGGAGVGELDEGGDGGVKGLGVLVGGPEGGRGGGCVLRSAGATGGRRRG